MAQNGDPINTFICTFSSHWSKHLSSTNIMFTKPLWKDIFIFELQYSRRCIRSRGITECDNLLMHYYDDHPKCICWAEVIIRAVSWFLLPVRMLTGRSIWWCAILVGDPQWVVLLGFSEVLTLHWSSRWHCSFPLLISGWCGGGLCPRHRCFIHIWSSTADIHTYTHTHTPLRAVTWV